MNSLFPWEMGIGLWAEMKCVCSASALLLLRMVWDVCWKVGGGTWGLWRFWEHRKRWGRGSCDKGVNKSALWEGGALASRGVGLVVDG